MEAINRQDFENVCRWALMYSGEANTTIQVGLTDGRKVICQVINLESIERFRGLGFTVEAGEAGGRVFPIAIQEV